VSKTGTQKNNYKFLVVFA